MKKMIVDEDYQEALTFIRDHAAFGPVYKADEQVRATLDCLIFLAALKSG